MLTIARLAARRRLRVAGLMSGTSVDGVNVAIVELNGRRCCLLASGRMAYPPRLRREIFSLFRPETARLDALCHLNFVLGEVFAMALKRVARSSHIPLSSVDLVGSHGQTIYHIPRHVGRLYGRHRLGSTLQIGEPSVIAERTGITTVADFRPRDLAAGGEGAPLVPYADYFLFRHPHLCRVIQNIGGIANATWLPARARLAEVMAFDTGPGNMIIDRIVSLVSGGRLTYDPYGRMAARGTVSDAMVAELLRHPFLRRRPPKSTGREEFGVQFADVLFARWRRKGLTPLDILASVTAFTARSIAEAYRRFLPGAPDEVIICGGGARNRTLLQFLRQGLQPARVVEVDEFGILAEAKEAVSFAILARETIRGVATNIPTATGARHPTVLGKIIPGRHCRL